MYKKLITLTATVPLLLFLAAGPAHAGKHDPIYTPQPIQVPAGKGVGDVKNVIRKALFDKNWEVRETGAGHIQGMYTKSGKRGSHTAVIDIQYDAKAIRINYKDSENLNYNKEGNTIHGTYNSWVRNVEKNIRAGLGAY
jgi:hypothetical protein